MLPPVQVSGSVNIVCVTPNVRVNADRGGRRCKPGNRKCTPYLLTGLQRLP